MNGIKTVVLLGALSALLLIGGEAIAGRQGLYMGLGIAFLMNFVGLLLLRQDRPPHVLRPAGH